MFEFHVVLLRSYVVPHRKLQGSPERVHSDRCVLWPRPTSWRTDLSSCVRPCSNSTPVNCPHHFVIRFTANHHLYVQQPSTHAASLTRYTLKYTPFKKTGYLKIKQSKCESTRATIPPQHFCPPPRLWLAAPPQPASPALLLLGYHRRPPWQSFGCDCQV
jgi:hypothetical protein